jgi:mannose-6-phosphate isomerase-like protein (cupin superfamily)
MHCHNADQTFYVIEGECTMRFPDGGEVVLKPGQAAMITGGSFYQLENAGPNR